MLLDRITDNDYTQIHGNINTLKEFEQYINCAIQDYASSLFNGGYSTKEKSYDTPWLTNIIWTAYVRGLTLLAVLICEKDLIIHNPQ